MYIIMKLTFLVYMQFYTESGLPFHVNMPTTVVARCMADPVIAPALHRYPVMSETYRYNVHCCMAVPVKQTQSI